MLSMNSFKFTACLSVEKFVFFNFVPDSLLVL